MSNRTYISLFRTYTDEKENLKTEEVNIGFDLITKVEVKLDLQVCTTSTIRGRNKTNHSYMNQREITISGAFSERYVDKVITALEKFNGSDKSTLQYKVQGNKLKNIQNLFFSFLKDTRLFHIHTRFKTYKNYVLTNCSFSYGESVSSINVDLTFLEVLFRQNEELYLDVTDVSLSYQLTNMSPKTEAQTFNDNKTSTTLGDASLINDFNNISKSFFERLM